MNWYLELKRYGINEVFTECYPVEGLLSRHGILKSMSTKFLSFNHGLPLFQHRFYSIFEETKLL